KLCTWAPTRDKAVAAMSLALDDFEVEGIGHNLPFLSAVMEHPRFQAGTITTAFIAEEWPEGFAGVEPNADQAKVLAAVAALINHRLQKRAVLISGVLANHPRKVGRDWSVKLNGSGEYTVSVKEDGSKFIVGFDDDTSLTITS